MSVNTFLYYVIWTQRFIPKLSVSVVCVTALLLLGYFILERLRIIENDTTKRFMLLLTLSPLFIFMIAMVFIIFLPGVISIIKLFTL